MGVHKNFIAGEWVDGVERHPRHQPLGHQRPRRRIRPGRRRPDRAPRSRPRMRPFPPGRAPRRRSATTSCSRVSTEILARREELGRLLSREEGKTLPEGIGEATRAGQIFDFFAGEALRIPGEKFASVRPERRHRGHARAARRRRHHRAVELPDRDPRLEDRPGAGLRQHGRVQARRPRPRLGPCAVRNHRARRRAEGRVQSRRRARLGGRPGDARPQESRRRHLHRLGRDRRQGRRRLRQGHAPVPARDGRQESAGRARRRRPQDRGRMRGQRRLFLDRPALHRLVAPDRRGADLPALRGRAHGADARARRRRRAESRERISARWSTRPSSSRISPISASARAKARSSRSAASGSTARTPGFYMAPALFLDADNTMRISREEIFGPVSAMIPARDYEHALAIANDTEFGLCAGICTDEPQARLAFQAQRGSGHDDGQSADGGRRLSCAVRRP